MAGRLDGRGRGVNAFRACRIRSDRGVRAGFRLRGRPFRHLRAVAPRIIESTALASGQAHHGARSRRRQRFVLGPGPRRRGHQRLLHRPGAQRPKLRDLPPPGGGLDDRPDRHPEARAGESPRPALRARRRVRLSAGQPPAAARRRQLLAGGRLRSHPDPASDPGSGRLLAGRRDQPRALRHPAGRSLHRRGALPLPPAAADRESRAVGDGDVGRKGDHPADHHRARPDRHRAPLLRPDAPGYRRDLRARTADAVDRGYAGERGHSRVPSRCYPVPAAPAASPA